MSDTASIIFHSVTIKHSRRGLLIFMKGRKDEGGAPEDRGGDELQEYLPGIAALFTAASVNHPGVDFEAVMSI